jgi:hypothetical protein
MSIYIEKYTILGIIIFENVDLSNNWPEKAKKPRIAPEPCFVVYRSTAAE